MDIDKEIEIKKDELAALEKMKELSCSPSKQLATLLHKKLCRWNHTDGCAWFYEEDNWESFSHKEYLNMANKMLKIADFELCVKMVNILS